MRLLVVYSKPFLVWVANNNALFDDACNREVIQSFPQSLFIQLKQSIYYEKTTVYP